MSLRLEDVLRPPASPEVRERRTRLLGALTAATALAGGIFLATAVLVGLLIGGSLRLGQWGPVLLWGALLAGVYIGCGLTLCAKFVNRLRLWGGAPLGRVVEAKAHFVSWWPWAATRLLLILVFHEATGGGGRFTPRGRAERRPTASDRR